MKLRRLLVKIARCLSFLHGPEDEPLTGLVAAIVSIERNAVSGGQLTLEDEEDLLGCLRRAVESHAGGQLDGTERTTTCVQWYFFARDVHTLEKVLLAEMRRESRLRGALLRVTSNGVIGPWRETRV